MISKEEIKEMDPRLANATDEQWRFFFLGFFAHAAVEAKMSGTFDDVPLSDLIRMFATECLESVKEKK